VDLKAISRQIQSFLYRIEDMLAPIENRWLIFIIAVVFLILLKAVGLHGAATLVALVYIMFFLTIKL
jgi:hypothetical protein